MNDSIRTKQYRITGAPTEAFALFTFVVSMSSLSACVFSLVCDRGAREARLQACLLQVQRCTKECQLFSWLDRGAVDNGACIRAFSIPQFLSRTWATDKRVSFYRTNFSSTWED